MTETSNHRRSVLPFFVSWMLLMSCAFAAAMEMTMEDLKTMRHSAENSDTEVTTEGVVVWASSSPTRFFYLQSKNLGIRVSPSHKEVLPQEGESVKVTGRLAWDKKDVYIKDASVEVTGRPGVPKAKRLSPSSMATGVANGTRVTVRGFLRNFKKEGSGVRVTLDADGVRIPMFLADADIANMENLFGQYGYINGVASPGAVPGSFEVLVPSFDDIYFRKQTPTDGAEIIDVRDLFLYRKGYSWGDRVRIRGQVVGTVGDDIHLNDGTGGIVVRGNDPSRFAIGDWLEALGFPEYQDGQQVFSDAELSPAPTGETITPETVQADDLLDPASNHRFVTITGKLIDFMNPWPAEKGTIGKSPLVLVLKSGETVFDVRSLDSDQTLPETGSILRVTGVCRVRPDQDGMVEAFSLLSFSKDQIVTLKGPGFFTETRLLILLCITLLVLTVTGFSTLLEVKRNAKLREEVLERKAILAERGRLAGDLHDTMEQILTAIHLQLHSLMQVSPMPETLKSGLASIQDMVRQCHLEIRHFVWDLRPAAMEKYDLSRALERMGKSLVLGTGTKITVRREGDRREIPSLVEDNLLRIGQEALTNAVKHAQPQEITISLKIENSLLTLEISDDGSGIPEQNSEGFGLRGLKERAMRIGGDLSITPSEGSGTSVKITVPLPAPGK